MNCSPTLTIVMVCFLGRFLSSVERKLSVKLYDVYGKWQEKEFISQFESRCSADLERTANRELKISTAGLVFRSTESNPSGASNTIYVKYRSVNMCGPKFYWNSVMMFLFFSWFQVVNVFSNIRERFTLN